MIIGTEGFIAWFYGLMYKRIRRMCKNIFVKLSIHSSGLIIMIVGMYLFKVTMPSLTSIAGLLLILIGLVVFVLPLGVEK